MTGFDLCRSALAVEGIRAPEQSVLTVLAIMANEKAQCWPPINGVTGLTGKTKLSERAVQGAIKALEAAGHITRLERRGQGVIYTVHPRTGRTPAQGAPPQELPLTPAGGAPKQPVTTIPKKTTSSRVARAKKKLRLDYHRLASDWKPTRFGDGSAAREVADRRGPVWCKAQLEDFHSWAANAEDKDGKGRKLDWQQAFAKWINEQDKKEPRGGSNRNTGNGTGGKIDGFTLALRRADAATSSDRWPSDQYG